MEEGIELLPPTPSNDPVQCSNTADENLQTCGEGNNIIVIEKLWERAQGQDKHITTTARYNNC